MSTLGNDKKRSIAERLYINDGMTAKAIAEQLDITEQTMVRWKKGREGEKTWDDRRAEVLSAPHKIKELVLQELLNRANGEKGTIDADAIIKLANAVEKLDKKVSVPMVISVFKEFDSFMAEHNPKLAIEFVKWHKAFVHYKAND
jgi:transposase-like protein